MWNRINFAGFQSLTKVDWWRLRIEMLQSKGNHWQSQHVSSMSSSEFQINNTTWSHLYSEIYVLNETRILQHIQSMNPKSLTHFSYWIPPPPIFWPDGGATWITWMSVPNSIAIQPVAVGIVYRTPQMSTSRWHERKSHALSLNVKGQSIQ